MKNLFDDLLPGEKITIRLEEMEFYAFHGCYSEERIVGNKFIVDLTIKINKNQSCYSDNLKHTINYIDVYRLVKEQMQIKSHLLEHVAQRIIDCLYKQIPGIKHVDLTVKKLNPPVGGQVGAVCISLAR